MDTLAQLFGSAVKVKLMRLFLFNPEVVFSLSEIARRVKVPSNEVRKEITKLIATGIVKKRSVVREIHSRKKGNPPIVKVHDLGYCLDQKFLYLQALKNLLITVSLHADSTLIKKFAPVGKLKLLIASGVFIQEWDTRIDLLIVGDDVDMTKLENVIKNIEAEVGKEISYSAFETEDFDYRLGIHDKLIRDILDAPHTVLIDRLGIGSNIQK
jgi:DNA-binding Lrp family transcriptional regulator